MTEHKTIDEYTQAVAETLEGLHAISVGACYGCERCHETCIVDTKSEMIADEGSFSWCPCGICGSSLAGNRYHWHWLSGEPGDYTLEHESDCCTDCLFFMANGDLPEHLEGDK